MKTEKDQLGITREISEGYQPSSILPGATTVPSNAGRFGGQRGVRLDDPIEVVINPGEKDEVRLSSKKICDRASVLNAMRLCNGDPIAVYKMLAEQPTVPAESEESMARKKADVIRESMPSEAEPQTVRAYKKVGHRPKIEQPMDARTGAGPGEFSPPDSPPPAVPVLGTILTDLLDRMHRMEQAMIPIPDPRQEGERLATESLARHAAEVKAQMQKASPVSTAKPVDTASEPAVHVTMKSDGGGVWSMYYHRVLVQDDLVVLVYDNRFKIGGRVYPPADMEKPYTVIVNGNGATETYRALHMGQSFTDSQFDYTILVVQRA